MFQDQQQLRIPGPVPVPPRVLMANSDLMINHRGARFHEILPSVLERLKTVFMTENTVLAITGSGTASMEAAVANLVNAGDHVLVLIGGTFGKRWADICHGYQAHVHEIQYEWGTAVDPEVVREYLKSHPEIRVVYATQNESSTGVLNDIEALGRVISETDALFVVDAVSSLGGAELKTDAWDVDIVCTATQKCLMCPPGVSLLSVSERAKKRMQEVKSPRFYLDLQAYDWMLVNKTETPYTPNISLIYALDEALKIMEAEGLEAIYTRHILMRDLVRTGCEALGFELLVDDKAASPTVTAVKPNLTDVPGFIKRLSTQYGIELGGGQGPLAGQIFRVGHMGYASALDMLTTLVAIETCVGKYGVASAAAEKLWNEHL